MKVIHADLRCNDTEVFKNPCLIDKVVELPAGEFSVFSHRLTDDYTFIHEMADQLTCDAHGINHCLLVLCEGQDDGILVKSEGYDYARYHSYFSNARQFVELDQHPTLDEFRERMCSLAAQYVKQAVESQLDGQFHIPLNTLYNKIGDGAAVEELFLDMLMDHAEIELMELNEDTLFLFIAPEYLVTENDDHLRRLTAKDVEIMCAKHTLWLNDAGGCRADFSNCLLSDLTLSSRCLDHAVFDGAKITNCNFRWTELNHTSFHAARIYNCEMSDLSAEDSVFKEARICNTLFDRSLLSRSNFTGADLSSSSVVGASMNDCCFEGTDFGDASLESASRERCSYSEADWLDESPAPGMNM